MITPYFGSIINAHLKDRRFRGALASSLKSIIRSHSQSGRQVGSQVLDKELQA